MVRPTTFTGELSDSWLVMKTSFVESPACPIMSTANPEFLLRQKRAYGRTLEFIATFFVALGLLATFVRLVAALSFAAHSIKAGDALSMQVAVSDLFAAASSKFVTSIAGVGLFVLLRIFSARSEARHNDLVRRIRRGIRVGTPAEIDRWIRGGAPAPIATPLRPGA